MKFNSSLQVRWKAITFRAPEGCISEEEIIF